MASINIFIPQWGKIQFYSTFIPFFRYVTASNLTFSKKNSLNMSTIVHIFCINRNKDFKINKKHIEVID